MDSKNDSLARGDVFKLLKCTLDLADTLPGFIAALHDTAAAIGGSLYGLFMEARKEALGSNQASEEDARVSDPKEASERAKALVKKYLERLKKRHPGAAYSVEKLYDNNEITGMYNKNDYFRLFPANKESKSKKADSDSVWRLLFYLELDSGEALELCGLLNQYLVFQRPRDRVIWKCLLTKEWKPSVVNQRLREARLDVLFNTAAEA